MVAEQANEELNTNLEELKTQTEEFGEIVLNCKNLPAGIKSSFEKLTNKVRAVEEGQKKAEKSQTRE